jgi:hypothetical protein
MTRYEMMNQIDDEMREEYNKLNDEQKKDHNHFNDYLIIRNKLIDAREQFEKIECPKCGNVSCKTNAYERQICYSKYLEKEVEKRDKVVEAIGIWKNKKHGYIDRYDGELIIVHNEYEASHD